ncbi:TetR/AcrR family transcriptional regulator [Hymenobacter sp. BT175]|uniref:TetR/AcrR family transcriptional regulator n=1 Tax=Hymenobacter translucens TaxID=2886507 RepID=UPI001D0DD93E|nr:TetR/AcrR family transcriptional regulator [Hymenobacter translucens]MCC2545663.1 TetR/AcrR family transcriptional regulator [Hymenobacter translucens]
MNSNFRNTLLDEAHTLFVNNGISQYSTEELMDALDISPSTFRELFRDKDDLVLQVMHYDIERQKQDHAKLFARVSHPVERLLGLLENAIQNIRSMSPGYLPDLIHNYPAAWEVRQQHLQEYSMPQIQGLLNDGVMQKMLRGDININLVSKIIVELVGMVINENTFPPARYDMAEVFRSVYLYYFRGLCTDEGMKSAAAYFARM